MPQIPNQPLPNLQMQQQTPHMPQPAEPSLDNHIGGNYPNLGPTTLANLDMTSRFGDIIPKTEQGITTAAGVSTKVLF